MKRDITMAIIVGFIIGAIVAVVLTNLPKIISGGIKLQSSKPSATPTIIQEKDLTSSLELTVNSPKDESISDSKNIDITGSAKPQTPVFIESEIDQITVETNDSGEFSGKINLTEGINSIFLTVYDEAGNSNIKNLTIFYTTEKL